MILNTVKNTVLEITLFLSVYASAVIINATLQGVTSSYVLLMALIEWIGCFLMDILLEAGFKTEDNSQMTWLVSATILVVLMAFVQPVTAIVMGLCYLCMVLIYEKYPQHGIAVLSSFAAMAIVTNFMISYLKTGKGFSLSMAICFMNFRMCRKWIVNHPKLYATLEVHDEKWKVRNCVLLSVIHVIEIIAAVIMYITVMRNGMYAIAEKQLYHPKEMIILFPVCILVLIFCCYLKEKLTLSDMSCLEKEVIPALSGVVTGMIAATCFVMRIYLPAGIFLGSCFMAMIALGYLLAGREKKHLKTVRVMLRPVSLFILVMTFLIVYNQYDGMKIDATVCGSVMAMLACMRMWIINLEELL